MRIRNNRFSFGCRLKLVLLFAFGILSITQLPGWIHNNKSIEKCEVKSMVKQGISLLLHVTESDQHKTLSNTSGKQNQSYGEKNNFKGKRTQCYNTGKKNHVVNRYAELESILQDLVAQEKGAGCVMPTIDPFSPEVTKFDKAVQPIICNGDDWIECKLSQCYVKQSILHRIKGLSCIYKDIVYVNDDEHFLGNAIKVKSAGKYTLNQSDFVRVVCSGLESDNREWWWSRWQGRKAGYRPLPTQTVSANNSLNIFLLVIDSVSRNAFMKRMPKSYKVLKNELNAVVMNSYNIVGEATAGALWPILTGHNELEVADCRKRPGNKKRVDPEPFLFTLLRKYGYRTAFFEDGQWGGTFNRLFNGFEHMPADHYMEHLLNDFGLLNKDVNKMTNNERYCFGSESMFTFAVDYAANMLNLGGKKFCMLVSASYSHDDTNMLTLVDKDLVHFLKKFRRDGHLEDTVLFVMGDHGPRLDYIRNTYYGRIDEHFPFVSVVLPERLKAARADVLHNLKVNSEVLTTPFDIHTTILDALDLKNFRNKYKVPGADFERGMSFLEPIPKSRGCAEAGIVPHMCMCTRSQKISPKTLVFTRVAKELADFINEVTEQVRLKCAKRNMVSIEWVNHIGPTMALYRYGSNKTISKIMNEPHIVKYERQGLKLKLNDYREYYMAKIIMDPGEAIFEGTVRFNVNKGSFSVTDRDVSRVDKYGNEPNCVKETHPHLAKYCFCI